MRRRFADQDAKVSLFPFLAVLLCTMGSLIVLLLIVVQQARLEAETVPEEPAPTSDEQHEEALARKRQFDEAAEQLEQARAQWAEAVEDSRLELSHLEDHMQRLRQRLAQLESDYQALKQLGQHDRQQQQQQLAALTQLRRQVQRAEEELKNAKQNAAASPRSYSIVPYDGPRGTHRRPIYIECLSDQLIIQPEGTILLPGDFEPPLDAGNPLAAALRATREYLAHTEGLRGGEPYPLLLVRPEGAEMYAAARAAMKSWSSEYGYELIDADMQLEYPPADEALGDIVRRTVAISRQRRMRLAMSHGFGSGRGAGGSRGAGGGLNGRYLSASRGGGFQMHGGSGNDDSTFGRPGGTSESAVTSSANAAAGRTDVQHNGDGPRGAAGNYSSRDDADPHGTGSFYRETYDPSSPRDSTSGDGRLGETAARDGGRTGRDQTGQRGSERGGSGPRSGSMAEDHSPQQAGTAQGSQSFAADDDQARARLTDQRPENQFATSGAQGGHLAAGSESQQASSGASSGGADSGGGAAGADSQDSASQSMSVASMSGARGSDWALPNAAGGSTGFTRPIRVECHADRLVVLPDKGTTLPAKVTQLDGPMQRSVDQFVSHLWQHMKGWGIAGPRAYWKPLLSVHVAPGGEARFRELSALLHESGIDIKRKSR